MAEVPDQNVKNWERYSGSNRFFCDGRAMTAQNFYILVFLFVLFGIITVLFIAFDARHLSTLLWPYGLAIPVVGLILLFYSLLFLLKAGCVDPGFLPRASAAEGKYFERLADADAASSAYLTRTVTINGLSVKLKFCYTCKQYRPPRSSHCSLCNSCCESFDHHCPWVGNCVAKRNYRYFYLFLMTVAVACVYVVCCNIATVALLATIAENGTFVEALKNSPASIVEALIAGFAFVAVIGLGGFHTCLIANMQTTNEEIKGTFSTKGELTTNPYSRGNVCKNFAVVLCGPFQPSLLQNRRPYKEQEEEILVEEYVQRQQQLPVETSPVIEATDVPYRELDESRTPPLLEDSPIMSRSPALLSSQNGSLEGLEISPPYSTAAGTTIEVEIFPQDSRTRDSGGSFSEDLLSEETRLLTNSTGSTSTEK